ncbi:FecCD family ABC transporter permease [Thermococcus sp.]
MKGRTVFTLLLLLSAISLFAGVYIGSVSLSPNDVTSSIVYGIERSLPGFSVPHTKPRFFIIVWELRLPRVLMAYLVGLSLASAGVASQAFFKNPMADPYLLGISGGAGIGAAIGFEYFPSHVSLLAFAFSLLAVYTVYSISKVNGRIPVDTLLLSGVAFGFMAGAVTSYFVSIGKNSHLTYMWLMGSFSAAGWGDVAELSPVLALGLSFFLWKWRELNLLLFGEESVTLGLNVQRFRKEVIFFVTLLTSVPVASTGIIGFVGLISPHIARLLVGPNHRRLTPAAALVGGILMVAADLMARVVAQPTEIPVGIVTAMMGGPFFLYLLRKHKRGELRR